MSFTARSLGLILTSWVLIGALGTSIGAYFISPPVPESLTGPEEISSVMTSTRAFNDERMVRATVELRESEPVITSQIGRVTALSLTPNSIINSGAVVMGVDGKSVIALHTTTPLYRDISDGVEGEDISALQEELTHLGYDIATTGKVNYWTRWALSDLMSLTDNKGAIPESISYRSIVWLPATQVMVDEVKVRLGDSLTESTTLMTLTGAADSGKITIPPDAIPGARVLIYQDKEYPVSDNGVIEDKNLLAELASSSTSDGKYSGQDESPANKSRFSVSLAWRLAHPLEVQVLPAAALFSVSGDRGCVASPDGNIHRVRIVGSELGQTFAHSENVLREVSLKTEGLSCQ